jgi:NADH-quinone oxidoreductase subunit K
MLTIGHFFTLSFVVFAIGIVGIVTNRKNIIVILISLEIILLAAGINFIAFSSIFRDTSGTIMALFVLAIAACEVAIGLALISVHFKSKGSIEVGDISILKDE